ncbi:MAG TPA: hypothetical protein VNT75_21955 [Symbiobacteriaceae bacterium]|nr:hypothetical protein [Symbiobacteriaceae bacterium]
MRQRILPEHQLPPPALSSAPGVQILRQAGDQFRLINKTDGRDVRPRLGLSRAPRRPPHRCDQRLQRN